MKECYESKLLPLNECRRGWDALAYDAMACRPRRALASPSFRYPWYSFGTHEQELSESIRVDVWSRPDTPNNTLLARTQERHLYLNRKDLQPVLLQELISSRKEWPNSLSKLLEQHLIVDR